MPSVSVKLRSCGVPVTGMHLNPEGDALDDYPLSLVGACFVEVVSSTPACALRSMRCTGELNENARRVYCMMHTSLLDTHSTTANTVSTGS